MLQVSHASKSFGGVKAVDDCSLSVERGRIVGLIGPNGAGKSTLFNVITGFEKPDTGEIYFKGLRITSLPPHSIARLGLVRTFQIARPLSRMTVLENLLLAAQGQSGERLWTAIFKKRVVELEEERHIARANELLSFLGLEELRHEPAGNLSTGQMKLLELGRALMASPEMLLLDEPLAGVNPALAMQILKRIKALQRQGMTFFIVEHNMEAIMSISEKIYALDKGKVIAEGTPGEVREDERVLEAYLGR